MAKRRTDPNRRNSGRRNFAAWLMTLLPGFMFLGLLAPAAVSVKPNEDSYGPVSFRTFEPKRPLQEVPLRLAHAIFENTAGDTGVFSGASYLVEQSKRVFEPEVETNDDDQIVLAANDGVEDYVSENV